MNFRLVKYWSTWCLIKPNVYSQNIYQTFIGHFIFILFSSQLPGEHTARLCLLAHRTEQSTVPSLPSPVPLFTSLVWRGYRMTYVRLAQGPTLTDLADHWVDALTNSATAAYRREGYPGCSMSSNCSLYHSYFCHYADAENHTKQQEAITTFTELA